MSEQTTIRMPDTSKLVVSSSPHYHDMGSIPKIMFTVLAALAPAVFASIYFFGWRALLVLSVCMVSCAAIEALLCRLMRRRISIGDGSALVTGLLLGMTLPVTSPLWMCIVGSFIAIGLGKMVYGGLGGNPFNPASVGRVALLLACPSAMTTWVTVSGCALNKWVVDATTGATPLELVAQNQPGPGFWSLFLGNIGGSIGETCTLALIVGGVFLIARKIIRWQIPVFFIGTVFLITGIAYMVSPCPKFNPMTHVLSGGLMLGAFFMATDMVTSPLNRKGAVVFAIGCGIITTIIRLWGSYPEGISYAILIMNALTPLIDRYTAGRPFGVARKASQKNA